MQSDWTLDLYVALTGSWNMKAMKFILLVVWVISCPVNWKAFSLTKDWGSAMRGSTATPSDTMKINQLVRTGIKYLCVKDVELGKVKMYIDSAFLLCEKLRTEVPSLLNLLNANYLFATGDYRQSEEEALTALETASNN